MTKGSDLALCLSGVKTERVPFIDPLQAVAPSHASPESQRLTPPSIRV